MADREFIGWKWEPNTFHWRILVDYASVRCKGLDPDLDVDWNRGRERESTTEYYSGVVVVGLLGVEYGVVLYSVWTRRYAG